MTKQIACPVCSGHGFISVIGENTISSYTCDHCNGAGEIEIPMTNADRIRAMSDEELAEWIARTQIGAIKDAMNLLRLPYDEGDEIVEIGKTEALEWLKQPAEGD